MSLGLGSNLSKSGLVTPGIVTDSLVLKHKYDAASVVPISDGAAYFDSTNDYISVSETTLSVHDTAYSFAFWVNLKDTGWHPIFGDDDAFYNTIAIDDDNDRIIIEGSSDGDNMQWNTIQDPLVLGAWNHFAICLDGSGSAKAYQNGVELTMTADTIGSDLIFKYIGKGTSYFLGGYLCNVAYWSSQLTQAQVKSIMNKNYAGLSTSEKTNLVSWWNLDTTLGGSGGTSVVVNSHDNTLGEELITGFVNGSTYVFDTLTTSGRNISAAVETSGDWAGAASNSLNLVEGEIYKCTFNLTYNSGTDTVRVLLTNTANGAATSVVDEVYYTNTNGVNEAYFRVKTTDSESFLQIGTWHSSDVINFNMTDISLKRLGGTTGKLT